MGGGRRQEYGEAKWCTQSNMATCIDTHIGLSQELLTNGHNTESFSPEVVRAWDSPGTTERTYCLDAKSLVLEPDINLQLLQFKPVLNAKKRTNNSIKAGMFPPRGTYSLPRQ